MLLKKLSLLLSVLILTLYSVNRIVNAASIDWVEVKSTTEGRQFWDRNSLSNEGNGVIEISTKYLKLEPSNLEVLEDNRYLMKIDCIEDKYEDISVNGIMNTEQKWEYSNKDTLISEVIKDSCQSIKTKGNS